MLINLEWLSEYVDIPGSVTAAELADRLTLFSLESVPLIEKSAFFDSMVVGEITSVDSHPDADNLTVCTVEAGEESPRQIICGAPNVAGGQKVPVVLPGTVLPDGNKIDAVTLRGVKSFGMIPSERELGLSDSHAGIMVLREEAETGKSFWEYLKKYWSGLDVEITPNRPDCMSHIGVAREFSALFNTALRKPEIDIKESDTSVDEVGKVVIHEPEKCPRYAARIIQDVKIQPSPSWLQRRLEAIGLRPINNVVDAANYVLMETGHPLHTFDLDMITGQTIEVRSAKNGEEFTTLDGKQRELTEEVLLICDAEKPVAIGGIMGGENSEVTDSTTNLLIESAYFNPVTVRRGSKFLGLSTEASKRFERGADPGGVIFALDRITSLIQQLAGGEVLQGAIDEYPKPISKREITIRADRASMLIGVDISVAEIKEVLESLGCEILESGNGNLTVTAPSFRPDLEREVDLIEEVLRFHGMDNVPAPGLFQYHTQSIPSNNNKIATRIENLWKGFGFNQTVSNSLVKKEYCFTEATGKKPVRLQNPLSEEMAYMRTTLLPGLVEGIRKNLNRRESDIRLFETGRVFSLNQDSATKAEEQTNLAAVASGNRAELHWDREQKRIDFYDFKGYIEALLESLRITGYTFQRYDSNLFEPGFELYIANKMIGVGGQMNEQFLDHFDIDTDAFGIEIDMDRIVQFSPDTIDYDKPSDFPSVDRDLSFVVPDNVEAVQLRKTLIESGGELLSSLRLYDFYKGAPVPEGKKSLTYTLQFVAKDRTLTEKEVDELVQNMLTGAAKEHNAYLREE